MTAAAELEPACLNGSRPVINGSVCIGTVVTVTTTSAARCFNVVANQRTGGLYPAILAHVLGDAAPVAALALPPETARWVTLVLTLCGAPTAHCSRGVQEHPR